MSLSRHCIALLLCGLLGNAAQAGRSSVGDASDVAEAGDCEAETSFERIRPRGEVRQREASLRLACGIGWDAEVEASVARQRGGDVRNQTLALEAKTTLAERGEGRIGWALALAVGAEKAGGGSWRHNEHSLTLEATYPLGATWLVEAKLGAQRERLDRRDSLRWAAAVEHAFSDRIEVRAQIEGDDRGRPLTGLAVKVSLWPEDLKLKLAHDVRSGPQAERRTSLSLQFEF
jgi:hypothetical protein